MKTLTLKEKKALNEFALKLNQVLKVPFSIYLYGSKARGDARKDSDIDVLVIIDSEKKEDDHKVTDISFDIMLKHGVFLSVMVLSKKKWEKYKNMPTSFAFSVQKDAMKL